MKKILSSIGLFLFGLFVLAATAHADTNCQPIYGGGQTCVTTGNIVITKQVQNPQTNSFVANLGINDPRFSPSQVVSFQLTVTNNGGTMINTVNTQDIFPQFVSFVAGPGTFNSANNTLSFTVDHLNAGESRSFTVQGKIADASSFGNQAVTCLVNQSIATGDNNQTSQSNSQFCVQTNQPTPVAVVTQTKGGLPIFPAPTVVSTPSTGPESLGLLGMIPTAIAGFLLRKKAK